jgi:hypothetical protein
VCEQFQHESRNDKYGVASLQGLEGSAQHPVGLLVRLFVLYYLVDGFSDRQRFTQAVEVISYFWPVVSGFSLSDYVKVSTALIELQIEVP